MIRETFLSQFLICFLFWKGNIKNVYCFVLFSQKVSCVKSTEVARGNGQLTRAWARSSSNSWLIGADRLILKFNWKQTERRVSSGAGYTALDEPFFPSLLKRHAVLSEILTFPFSGCKIESVSTSRKLEEEEESPSFISTTAPLNYIIILLFSPFCKLYIQSHLL